MASISGLYCDGEDVSSDTMSMHQHFLQCVETGRMVTFPCSAREKDLNNVGVTRSIFGIVRTTILLLSTMYMHGRVYVPAAYFSIALSTSRR